MGDIRKRYSVYGRLKTEKRAYINEWLGYVKSFNSSHARDEATLEFGKLHVITKILKERTGR